jgi:hypothetical protein
MQYLVAIQYLEISGIVPSPEDISIFRPGLMKSYHMEPGNNVPIRTRVYSMLGTEKLR